MNNEDKIVINFIGIGYEIAVGALTEVQFQTLSSLSAREGESLQNLFFDADFFENNPVPYIGKSGHYKSWSDFNNQGIFTGPSLMEKGQMEIWINRKRIKTYKFFELLSQATLFPIFKADTFSLPVSEAFKQLIVGVQEKGHLAKYVFKTKIFNSDLLKLDLIRIPLQDKSLYLLNTISYNGVRLISTKHDTVITGMVFK